MRIQEFPLAWRWTDPKYVQLPVEVLAQICPLDDKSASAFYIHWSSYFDRQGEIIKGWFSKVETCSTEGTWKGNACLRETSLTEQVQHWLQARESDIRLPVIVSWRRDCAVRTTWGIFTHWWDDFCYPSSDDVVVMPEAPRWLLAFHHEDWFSFCIAPLV